MADWSRIKEGLTVTSGTTEVFTNDTLGKFAFKEAAGKTLTYSSENFMAREGLVDTMYQSPTDVDLTSKTISKVVFKYKLSGAWNESENVTFTKEGGYLYLVCAEVSVRIRLGSGSTAHIEITAEGTLETTGIYQAQYIVTYED